jgi:hypothetical protein
MRRISGAVLISLAVVLVGAAACRFGGPSADPNEYLAFTDAAVDVSEDDGSSGGSNLTDSALEAELDATFEGTAFDGAESGDSAAADDSTADSVAIHPSPDGSPEAATCQPTASVCDPVHNTGCNPTQRCDVNSTQTQTPTGLCVFDSPSDAATCLATLFTESCGPGSTCVGGACRALCYCDSDCPTGQCCSGTAHAGGFVLCESCE